MTSNSGFSFKKMVPKVCDHAAFDNLQSITSNSEIIWAASTDDNSDYKKIATQASTTLAIKSDGSLWGWGLNSNAREEGGGRLARYHNQNAGGDRLNNMICSPSQIVSGEWKDVSVAPAHAVGVKCDGTLWTWGSNNPRFTNTGNLGFSFSYYSVSEPTQTVARGNNWKLASAGPRSTSAIKTDGTLWFMGDGYTGRCYYDGNNSYRYLEPVIQYTDYENSSNTELISSNVLGSAGLTESNDPTYKNPVYWPSDPTTLENEGGRNSWWELEIPFDIEFESKTYNKIFVNSNSYITIGNWPGYVDADINYRGINWSYRDSSFNLPKIYLGAGENVYCKRIFYGAEGSAPTRTYRVRYESIGGEAWEVTFYEEFPSRIDIQQDGSIPSGYTTVTNEKGFYPGLGFNDIVNALAVGGLRINGLFFNVEEDKHAGATQWKNVAAGDYFNVALKNNGTLWTWGCGQFGELGTLDGFVNSPIQTVAGGSNWKSISLGTNIYCFTCFFHTIGAIKTDGTLWTWGNNLCGVLGTGLYKTDLCYAYSPVQTAAGGCDWKSISMAVDSAKAIKCDGSMWTWGTNRCYANGHLNSLLVKKGKNTGSVNSPKLVDIAADKRWKCVTTAWSLLKPDRFYYYLSSCGKPQTISLDEEGNLWGWGTNYHSSLGLGIFSEDLNNIKVENYCVIKSSKKLGETGVWSSNVDIESTDTKISTAAQQCFSGQIVGKAAIKNDGTLWVWGCSASDGRLGLGDGAGPNPYRSSPVQTVAGGTDWKSVSNNLLGAMALKTDGTLWAWGQCITSDLLYSYSPVQIFTDFCWNQISSYSRFLSTSIKAAIRDDGTLWLWSFDAPSGGALGDNSNIINKSSPVQTIAGGTNWKQVCVQGTTNVSAIKTDGTLWAWGTNNVGELGDFTTTRRSSPVQTVSAGTNWKQVTGNNCNTLATKTDGTLWAWGEPSSLLLGNISCSYNYYNQSSPVQTLAGGTDWKKVELTAGSKLVTAIKCDNTLWWWGRGFNQEDIANGIPRRYGGARRPNINPYVCNPVQLSYGMALTQEGNLYSWGCNIQGQAGFLKTDIIDIISNNDIEYTETLVDLADEFFTRECFTRSGLWSNGYNRCGLKFGIGCLANGYSQLTQTSANFCWSSVSSYNSNVLAVKCDGSLWSWGINCFGKLGLGDTNPRFEIQPVGNSCDWAQIISGWDHSSAIKCNGSLWSWGKGECGLTGLNISTDTCVPTLLDCGPWKSVSADSQGGKALKCDGTLWLWGRDDCGRIGNNYYNEYAKTCFSSPVQTISGGTDWCSISNRYSFAIKTNGTLWGWGNNGNGQLGTDDTIPRSSPTQTVSGGTNWKQVIATLENLFATKTDGTLWSAGRNYAGQLGTGDNISKSSPVQTTAGGTNWRCLLESTSSVFATKNDGTLWGWGRNTYTLPSDPGGYAVFGTCLNDYIVTSPIQICNGVKGFWKTGSGGMFQTFIGVFESEADDL